jgi:hypothetical protein
MLDDSAARYSCMDQLLDIRRKEGDDLLEHIFHLGCHVLQRDLEDLIPKCTDDKSHSYP